MFLVTKDTTTTFSPSKLKATRQSSEVPSFLPIWYIKSLLSLRGMIFPPNESFFRGQRASERASPSTSYLSLSAARPASFLLFLSSAPASAGRVRTASFLFLFLSLTDHATTVTRKPSEIVFFSTSSASASRAAIKIDGRTDGRLQLGGRMLNARARAVVAVAAVVDRPAKSPWSSLE